ncbi:RsiV family protein [Psychrobacter sp.]|uniref:RsiV family protein n=1 Tax=unclassified Psychrobacter TaxID=196806 RepID=UPI003F975640
MNTQAQSITLFCGKRAAHLHTKPRTIWSLSMVLLLSAASLTANADSRVNNSNETTYQNSLINNNDYLHYSLPDALKTQCIEHNNCPEIEIEYLKTNQQWINSIVNTRINTLIVNNGVSESGPVATTVSKQAVTQALTDFATAQFTDLPVDSSLAYQLMVTPTYLGHIGKFELFEISTYVYTGGAHGMPYSEYLMFDSSTQKQVTLDDMVPEPKKSRFKALAYDSYKAWVKTIDEDVSSYEETWPFVLSDNVILTDQGIDIQYQPYAIGAYAYGMPTLSIPYSHLTGILNPEFMPK